MFSVSRVLHAGYIFESQSTRVLFDPVFETPFSRNCYAFPAVHFDLAAIRAERFDAVFISHFHDDHFSLESLDLIARDTPIYFYCRHEELFGYLRAMGFRHVHSLVIDEAVMIGPIRITALRALQDDVDSLFQVAVGPLNILNVVDSWINDDQLARLCQTPWDLILWPFQTMREIETLAPKWADPADGQLPKEAIAQLRRLNPRAIVPSSCQFRFEPWSWKNAAFFPISYANFARTIQNELPAAQVIRLDPGESIELDAENFVPRAPLIWVAREDGPVDYHYEPDLIPPPTREMARRFGTVTEEQRRKATAFCEHELPRRFREIGAPAEPYFKRARVWRLRLFDEQGVALDFTYRVDEDVLALITPEVAPEWTTELPLLQLLNAREEGESLSSMYIRINDFEFAPAVARALELVDVVDDPLLRCLFNGAPGAYQAAQLARLRARDDANSRLSPLLRG